MSVLNTKTSQQIVGRNGLIFMPRAGFELHDIRMQTTKYLTRLCEEIFCIYFVLLDCIFQIFMVT
jgi:hypothetical protein